MTVKPSDGITSPSMSLCEFCEVDGPKVIEYFSSDFTTKPVGIDNFAISVLSVDLTQRKEITSLEDLLANDHHSVVAVPDLKCHAFVYNFHLYDVNARGNVRPLVLSLFHPSSSVLMLHHRDLLKHLVFLSSCLRFACSITVISDILRSCFDLLYTLTLELLEKDPAEVVSSLFYKHLRKRILSNQSLAMLNFTIGKALYSQFSRFSILKVPLPTIDDIYTAIKFIDRLVSLSESRVPVVSSTDPNDFSAYFSFSSSFFSLDNPEPVPVDVLITKPLSTGLSPISSVCSLCYPYLFTSNNQPLLLGPVHPVRLMELLMPFDFAFQDLSDSNSLDYFLIGNIVQSPVPSASIDRCPPIPPPPRLEHFSKEAISPSTLDDGVVDGIISADNCSDLSNDTFHSCSSPIDSPYDSHTF
ncbi:hypothetical protein GEMRC1_002161 [Eukaryota sp. GEM-RC1]